MYNLRHSFGRTLAQQGIDVRTIQALMRHNRLTTTEQYVAYRPQPELAERMTRALDPRSVGQRGVSGEIAADGSLLARLQEELPARWATAAAR